MNKITRSITINETLWNNFKAACAKNGVNMSEVIFVLIENYINKQEKEKEICE